MKIVVFIVTTWCKFICVTGILEQFLYLILRAQVTFTQKTIVLQNKMVLVET